MRLDRLMAIGIAALLTLSLVAVACAGDSGDTGPADETPNSVVEDGEGADDLQRLASEAADGRIAKITYRVLTESNGDSFEGEWVVVQRPPDSRMEFSTSVGEGVETRTVIISAGGRTFLCFEDIGTGNCIETTDENTEAERAPLTPLFTIPRDLAQSVEGVEIAERSRETIAGLEAECFRVRSGIAGLSSGQVCFAADGTLLRLRTETEGQAVVFEATSVTADVTDADFEPPYEIVDLPDIDFDLPEE